MLAATKRILRKFFGALLVLLGIVVGPLPGPLGIPLILAGLALLGYGPQTRAFLHRVWAAIKQRAASWRTAA